MANHFPKTSRLPKTQVFKFRDFLLLVSEPTSSKHAVSEFTLAQCLEQPYQLMCSLLRCIHSVVWRRLWAPPPAPDASFLFSFSSCHHQVDRCWRLVKCLNIVLHQWAHRRGFLLGNHFVLWVSGDLQCSLALCGPYKVVGNRI